MRATFVVVATLLTLAGCGEDPILRRAREAEEAKRAAAAGGGAIPGDPGAPGPAAGGTGSGPENAAGRPEGGGAGPGAGGAPTPVQAAPPPPGDPRVPPPGGTVGTPTGEPPPVAQGVVAADAPGRVQAADPPRGVPAEPKPAPPGAPGGGAPGGVNGGAPGNPGAPPPVTGPTIVLSGVVVYPAWSRGSVRVDVFDGDHTVHGTHPGVVASTRLDKPGPFSVTVPQNAGKLYVEAVVDEDLDGRPGPQDPMGTAERYPVTARTSDVGGLTVTLVKHAAPGGSKKKGDF